jgi:preprotein translocase subunit SecG
LLVLGIVVAVVSAVLLLVVLGLDAFTATVYSVGGKSIDDPTAEAAALRDQYLGAKIASIVGLIVGGVFLVGSLLVMYFNRSRSNGDEGDDLSFDELAGE